MFPYPSVLLNELHQHFPELLYRAERFQTVQDVLRYVIDVAQQSPYERAFRQYHDIAAAPREEEKAPPLGQSQQQQQGQQSQDQAREQEREQERDQEHPHPLLVALGAASQRSLADELLHMMARPRPRRVVIPYSLFSGILPDGQEEKVTEQQLAENTYVYRSEVAYQDNCAICQEAMLAGQETRTILACSHCFHRECVDRWFEGHARCPTCRRDVREAS